VIQVFGTKKCADTRKAERFFRERGVPLQAIDLATKGPSPGELRSIAQAVGGVWKLLDKDGKRARAKGLAHALLGDPDIERALLADPRLLRTPVVRSGKAATVGPATADVVAIWTTWVVTERT
jgi:arsenate reductase-like glutaredoxin family protein